MHLKENLCNNKIYVQFYLNLHSMFKAHQIKLNPTKKQEQLFIKSCGVSRFSYNWALNKWMEDNKNGIKQSAYTLIKYLNSIKKIEFPWMQDTSKNCSQYAIHNLESAFKKMWKEKSGYPKFKKKGRNVDSFVGIENKENFSQKEFKIKVSRIGWIKCCENLRFEGKVNNVVIKRVADIWFAIVNIEVENTPIEVPTVNKNQVTVGIDLGINSMIVLSDGTIYKNPKALKLNLKKLKRLQRGLSRKNKGSNNSRKYQIKLARLYYRIQCIRKNHIHNATSEIIKKYGRIVIETLRVSNMLKNGNLAQSICDVSFGEISRQLAYKAQWYNKELVKADMWYASSKTCSTCGCKKKILKLKERVYKCDNCGLVIDRDLNAAINLAKYSPTLKLSESNACGGRSSCLGKSLPMKQEIEMDCNKIKNSLKL